MLFKRAFLVAKTVKNLPAGWETWVRFLGQENALEKEMAIFLPVDFHGRRSIANYSPSGCKESDTTEQLTHTCLLKECTSVWRS